VHKCALFHTFTATSSKEKGEIDTICSYEYAKDFAKKKKLQINAKSNHSKISDLLPNEQKEREFLM
jgi:glutathione peroxidase-family protein